jgi:hypothetical protein
MMARMGVSRSTPANYLTRNIDLKRACGGSGGIRTHDTVPRMPVFKTGAFNHSATLPLPTRGLAAYDWLMSDSPRQAVPLADLPTTLCSHTHVTRSRN